MTEKRKPPIRQRPIQVKFFCRRKRARPDKTENGTDGNGQHECLSPQNGNRRVCCKFGYARTPSVDFQMKRISNSENQIAKQLNTTGNIYEADIEEIKRNQEEIYEGIKKILLSLSHLK